MTSAYLELNEKMQELINEYARISGGNETLKTIITSVIIYNNELHKEYKYIFTPTVQQKGGKSLSTLSTDIFKSSDEMNASPSLFSETSDMPDLEQKGGQGQVFSPTSTLTVSETNDFKPKLQTGGQGQVFSPTSTETPNLQTGGQQQVFSPTSTDENMQRGGKLSVTSDFKPRTGQVFSPTSSETPMVGGYTKLKTKTSNKQFNSSVQLNKISLIKQQIKELDEMSELDLFQKNKYNIKQSGGNSKQFNQLKQQIGINSSSTSSFCD